MNIFDQREFACRCEWGPQISAALAPADVIIVVDVLSFTTCVDIAVSRGVLIWPARPGESVPAPPGAVVAGRRGQAEYSLSPASFLTAPDGLHCILPPPNGAALARATCARLANDGRMARSGLPSRIGSVREPCCADCREDDHLKPWPQSRRLSNRATTFKARSRTALTKSSVAFG